MMNRPDRYLDDFLKAGSDIVTVHVESPCDINVTLARIRAAGRKPGITLRPGTSLETLEPHFRSVDLVLVMSVEPGFGGQSFIPGALERIRSIAARRAELGLAFEIEVDGGIDDRTGPMCVDVGADVLVSGNHLFRQASLDDAVQNLKTLCHGDR